MCTTQGLGQRTVAHKSVRLADVHQLRYPRAAHICRVLTPRCSVCAHTSHACVYVFNPRNASRLYAQQYAEGLAIVFWRIRPCRTLRATASARAAGARGRQTRTLRRRRMSRAASSRMAAPGTFSSPSCCTDQTHPQRCADPAPTDDGTKGNLIGPTS